jgi:sec-independent protein translocase protein TatB
MMFEISWSELLILGIVTLVFVGPKELPVFMRTLGRYASVVRRHANEFKAQFDAAMREAELDSMREEVDKMQTSINAEVMRGKAPFEEAGTSTKIEKQLGTIPSQPEAEPAAMPPMPAPPRMEP